MSTAQTTFGFVNCWAKEPKDTNGLKTLIEKEFQLPDGLLLSGQVSIKPEQLEVLIEYLSDPANCGQYGVSLDLALFYNESAKVKISGKLNTPYKKGDAGTTTSTTSKARRTV
jgi:hypothetical protein